MTNNSFRIILSILISLSLVSSLEAIGADQKPRYRGHIVNGIDWVAVAAEYDASILQAYNTATGQLKLRIEAQDSAVIEKSNNETIQQTSAEKIIRSKPKAIIIDVDETILSNLTAQIWYEESGRFQQDLWEKWVDQANAPALPGALKFINQATEMGVTVFYVTNRKAKLESATRKNLANLGFPLSTQFDNLLMKNEREDWIGNKTSRRLFIANDYHVIMLIGDNLHDFIAADNLDQQQRKALVEQYAEYWGNAWFMIPNSMYGSWLKFIGD